MLVRSPCQNNRKVAMRSGLTLAIMQPYFLPYLGYFQLMAKADAFVLFDDVPYINRGWINRNRININGEAHLFTVPLQQASQNRLICEILVGDDPAWRKKMLKSVQQAYARAPQISRTLPLLESIVNHPASNLADYLRHSLATLRDYMGLSTELIDSSRRYGNRELKAQARIIDICQREKAGNYINAIGGTELYERAAFEAAGMELAFLNPVLRPYDTGKVPFVPGMSIIDVLMHNDPEAVAEHLNAGTLS
jgi:hypothetical protein